MWARYCTLAIVLAVVATACAPAGVEPATERSPTTTQSTASPPGSDRTFGELFAQRLPAILATTSEFQKALLEDGVVTAAEHERAQLAFIACIEEAGVTIVQLERTATGLISLLSVGGTPTAEAQGEVEEVVAVCDETFYSDIDDAYRVALHPDDTEATQLQREGGGRRIRLRRLLRSAQRRQGHRRRSPGRRNRLLVGSPKLGSPDPVSGRRRGAVGRNTRQKRIR